MAALDCVNLFVHLITIFLNYRNFTRPSKVNITDASTDAGLASLNSDKLSARFFKFFSNERLHEFLVFAFSCCASEYLNKYFSNADIYKIIVLNAQIKIPFIRWKKKRFI